MKQLLSILVLVCALATGIDAQITIRRSDFPVSGTVLDSAKYRLLSKVGLTGVVSTGNNQTWDFSTVRDSTTIPVQTYYYAPANLFGALPANQTDATFAYNYSSQFQVFTFPSRAYEKLDSTGYYYLGYATNGGKFGLGAFTGATTDTIYFPAVSTRYTPPLQQLKYPMTANTSWATNSRINSADFQLTIGAFGLNRTPGQRITIFNNRDTILGWGTLKMRNPSGGNVLNFAVLLHRSLSVSVDSFYVGGAPAPAALLNAFALTQGAVNVSNPFYEFRAIGFSEPPMSFSTNANATQFQYFRAVNNTQGLTTATREYDATPVVTKAYPNPTKATLTLDFEKTSAAEWNVMVYNLAGQIISITPIKADKGAVNQTLTLDAGLPDGAYFYNLVDEFSLIRANGQFQLSK